MSHPERSEAQPNAVRDLVFYEEVDFSVTQEFLLSNLPHQRTSLLTCSNWYNSIESSMR